MKRSARYETSRKPPLSSVGMVKHCVEASVDAGGYPLGGGDVVAKVREGLPISELDELQQSLGQPLAKVTPLLGLSKSTLHRRRANGKLAPEESDRVIRYARLLGMAANVMESLEAGRRWLSTPQVALGGEIPLEFAETEVGAREVEALLGRLDSGVYP